MHSLNMFPYSSDFDFSDRERKNSCISTDQMSCILSAEKLERNRNRDRKYRLFFALIAPSADLVTLWRYPYIVHRHGGEILIPLVILYFLIGWPIYTLEMNLGRLSVRKELSGHLLSNFIPLLKGFDVSASILIAVILIYQVTVINWIILYLFTSVQEVVPWAECGNYSHITDCVFIRRRKMCQELNISCSSNFTKYTGPEIRGRKYFHSFVATTSDGIDDLGFSSWPLILCLFFVWVITYLNAINGKLRIKKRKFIPSAIILSLLTALFSVSFNYDGVVEGIKMYLTIDGERLKDPLMWNDALTQVILSLNIGCGFVTYFSSCSQNQERSAFISAAVVLTNIIISFYGGLVIYSWLGVLATYEDLHVLDLLPKGFGFSFIMLTSVIGTLPVPSIWAALLFLLMAMISIIRIGRMLKTLAANIQQLSRISLLKSHHKYFFLVLCIVMSCFGIILTYGIGYHVLFVLDCWVIGFSSLLFLFLEILAVLCLYGLRTFLEELGLLKENFEYNIWRIIWGVITPATAIIILAFICTNNHDPSLAEFSYGKLGRTIGWCMVAILFSPGFIYVLFIILKLSWIKRKKLKNITEVSIITESAQESIQSYLYNKQMQQRSASEAALTYHVLLIREEENGPTSRIPYGFLLSPSKNKYMKRKLPKLYSCPEAMANFIPVIRFEPSTPPISASRRTSASNSACHTPITIHTDYSQGECSGYRTNNNDSNLLNTTDYKGVVNEAFSSQ